MKKIISLFCICFFYFNALKSQQLRISVFEGWTLEKVIDNYHYENDYYEGTIEGSWRQGLGIAFFFDNAFDVGILYYRQYTNIPATYYTPTTSLDKNFDLRIQWALLEFTAYLLKKRFRSFLGSDIGMGFFKLKDPSASIESSRTKFTWGGHLGTEFSFSKFVALKLKADFLYSVRLNDSPSHADIIAYNYYLQTGFSAGLVVKINIRK